MPEMTMIQALNTALREAMEEDETIVVLGEDVGVDGGVFRLTDGLIDDFGEDRVIDTPVAESAIIGMSLGMAMAGLKPIPELQFSGFSYYAFHQIESHVSRMRWRSRGRFTAPMVVRMPYGAGVRALEHHSESMEVLYAHIPGIKTVVPSGPRNARALLAAAIQDPDPVIFFEPKISYRAFREDVPEERETMPIGEPQVIREGSDITIVCYGGMFPRARKAAERLAEEDGAEAELIDLLTVSPLDDRPITESVRRTGRAVIVHEAHRTFGPGAELVARLVEKSFWYLEAPVERVTGYDTIVPYFAREQSYLPDEDRILTACRRVLATE